MALCKLHVQLVLSVILLHTVALFTINIAWYSTYIGWKVILGKKKMINQDIFIS